MSRVWIGGSQNLKPGDVIVDWSHIVAAVAKSHGVDL